MVSLKGLVGLEESQVGRMQCDGSTDAVCGPLDLVSSASHELCDCECHVIYLSFIFLA